MSCANCTRSRACRPGRRYLHMLNFPPKENPIDTVIINAAECGPFNRRSWAAAGKTEDVILGLRAFMKVLMPIKGLLV